MRVKGLRDDQIRGRGFTLRRLERKLMLSPHMVEGNWSGIVESSPVGSTEEGPDPGQQHTKFNTDKRLYSI